MRNIKELTDRLDALLAAGDLDGTESFFQREIALAGEAGDDEALLTLYNERQGFLRSTGRAGAATEDSLRVLQLMEKLSVTGTPLHANALINAGTTFSLSGQNQRALTFFREAEAVLKGCDGNNVFAFAALYNNMSHICAALGEHEEALAQQKKALELVRTVPGTEGAAAVSEQGIAASLMALGREREAGEYVRSAMDYVRTEQGQRDPHRSAVIATAAEYALRTGKGEEAVRLYEEALSETERFYGKTGAYSVVEENLKKAREWAGRQ